MHKRHGGALQYLNRDRLGLDGLPMPVGHCRGDLVFPSLNVLPSVGVRRFCRSADQFAIGKKVNVPHFTIRCVVAGIGRERNRCGRHKFRPRGRRGQLDRRRVVHRENNIQRRDLVLIVSHINDEFNLG